MFLCGRKKVNQILSLPGFVSDEPLTLICIWFVTALEAQEAMLQVTPHPCAKGENISSQPVINRYRFTYPFYFNQQ